MTLILIAWSVWTVTSFLPFLRCCPAVLSQPTKLRAYAVAVFLTVFSPLWIVLKLRKFALSQVIWP